MNDLVLSPISLEMLSQIIENAVNTAIAKFERNKPQQPNADELLTQNQAAKFLNITVPTLIEWKRRGYVKYRKINAKIFYSKNELLESMARYNNAY